MSSPFCFLLSANQAVATFDALFGLGVGTIAYKNFSCSGNEATLVSCSNQTGTCTHFQDAGVDCLGRPLRECIYVHTLTGGGGGNYRQHELAHP